MPRKRMFALFLAVFLTISLACNLQAAPVTVGGTGGDATAQMETQVAAVLASTAAAQTAIANAVLGTQGAQPDQGNGGTQPDQGQQPQPSDTPEFTFTPSLTPTDTLTLTPSVITVTVSVNTFCRSGPTPDYDQLGIMMVGEQAEVIGRSTLTDTMIIKLPSDPSIHCWLWAANATVNGDLKKLPIVPIPPTPTPKATNTPQISFALNFAEVNFCSNLWWVKFKINNNGSLTWESDRVIVTDTNTSVTKSIDRNNFPYYNSSCVASADLNLEPGEIGYTTSLGFGANPSGHSMTATLRLCSQDGLGGTCIDKTINFTP